MKKIFFLLVLIYFIDCQSDQKDCHFNSNPANEKECFSRKVTKENVQCCFLKIYNNGEFIYNDCHMNDDTLDTYIEGYKNDFGEGTDVKVQCTEDTPNKALFPKIGFLLILSIIIL